MTKNKMTKMFNSVKKIIATLLIAAMNGGGLSAVFGTYAMFSDTETSTDNAFAAGSLAFTATGAWGSNTVCNPDEQICPTGDITDVLTLTQEGSLGFNYSVSIINAGDHLCDYLTINGSPQTINNGYQSPPILYDSANNFFNAVLHLTSGVDSEGHTLEGLTCDFDYAIKAWQTNLLQDGGGFVDTQIIHRSITADPWTVAEPASEPEADFVPDLHSQSVTLGMAAEGGTESDGTGDETKQEEQTEPPAESKEEEAEVEAEVEDPVVDGGTVLTSDPVVETPGPAIVEGGDGGGEGEGSEGVVGEGGGETGSEGGASEGE